MLLAQRVPSTALRTSSCEPVAAHNLGFLRRPHGLQLAARPEHLGLGHLPGLFLLLLEPFDGGVVVLVRPLPVQPRDWLPSSASAPSSMMVCSALRDLISSACLTRSLSAGPRT